MNAQTLLIVVILIIVLIPAITSTWKHMKGEGDCCGGPKEKPVKKKIDGHSDKTLKKLLSAWLCFRINY